MNLLAGLIALSLLLSWAMAQATNPAANDKCVVHLDKSFYINGEVIWYKVYLPDIVRNRSVALKIAITNESGRVIDYSFLKTGGKTYASGYYKIPFDIVPGVYHLFVLGTDEVNRIPVALADIPVPIYSDERIPASVDEGEQTVAEAVASPANELRVEVELENENVRSREEVRVRVKVTDANGQPVRANLSLAATDWELAGAAALNLPTVQAGKVSYPGTFYNLSGSLYTRYRLVNNVGEPLQANVLGAFSSEDNEMFYTKTNPEGVIFLQLPDFHGRKPLQFVGYENEYEQIAIAPIEEITEQKVTSLVYTPGIVEYLNYSRQRKKIFQMYTTLEFLLDPEMPAREPKTLEEDFGINMQEYERFENLASFFREVLTPLRFREVTDTSYAARMYNPRMKRVNNYFPGKPLFIIDGKITRDGDFVAKMTQDYIQRIDIFYEPAKLRQYFNVFGNNGVTRITTDLPDIDLPAEDEEDIVEIRGLQPNTAFPAFDPSQVNAYQPMFRPQLYWNPDVETDANGEATFTYYQSDDKSTFRIEVVAQGAEGAIGLGRVEYLVE